MNIVFAALADAANVSVEGKLNIHGSFDTIGAREVPCRQPSMVLAFRIHIEYEDQHKPHPLKIVLEDEDGHKLWGAETEISVGQVEPGRFGHVNQIIRFRDIVFADDARYKFRMNLGDQPPHDVVFQVQLLDSAAGGDAH